MEKSRVTYREDYRLLLVTTVKQKTFAFDIRSIVIAIFALTAFVVFAMSSSVAFAEDSPGFASTPYPVYDLGETDAKTITVGDFVQFGSFDSARIDWQVTGVRPGAPTVVRLSTSDITLPQAFSASHWNDSDLRRWLNGIATGQFANGQNFSASDYRAISPATTSDDGVNSIDRFFVDGFDNLEIYDSSDVVTIHVWVDLTLLQVADGGEGTSGNPYAVFGTSSLHGDYTVSTKKCASCHSVHQANSDQVDAGVGSYQFLLETTVANVCAYCHIETNTPVRSDVKVYDGVVANYNQAPSEETTTSGHRSIIVGGVETGVTCARCHTVHGGDVSGNPYLDANILRNPTVEMDYPILAADDPQLALSKWCVQCHDSGNGSPHTGHGQSGATDFRVSSEDSATRIAWQDVDGCVSCHGAGTDSSAFPHFVDGASKFLMSASSAEADPVFAQSPMEDGVCLRCHRQTDTSGVGYLY